MKKFALCAALAVAIALPFSAWAKPKPKPKPKPVPEMKDSFLEIPWSDFKVILEELLKPEPEPEAKEEEEPEPPMPYAITSASYEGVMDSGSAAVDFIIKFTVLEDEEWQMIPALPAELAVDSVELDGKQALVSIKDGWRNIALFAPGQHTLTGRFFVKPQNRLGPRSVSFPIAPTPVTTLAFTVPEPGLAIEADPSNYNHVLDGKESTRLEAVLPYTGNVTISWGKRVEAEEAKLRLNATVESLVSLGERLCRVESLVRYEILHRGVTRFRLAVPDNASVVDVSGRGVADWKVNKKENRRIITVSLNYEAKGAYDLFITYEITLKNATAEANVPQLIALGADREIGYLGVAARTNIEVQLNSLKNLATIDASDLPSGIAARSSVPLIFGFKYIGHPWELDLQATRHKEVAVLTFTADRADLHSFLTEEGELITRAAYTVRNNREQFMRIRLPEGARVFSAFRDNLPVRPAKDAQGRVLIPLEKSTGASGQARQFSIEITYLTQLPVLKRYFGDLPIQAPETDVMTNQLHWTLYLPTKYKYSVKHSTLKKASAPPQAVITGGISSSESSSVPAGKDKHRANDEDRRGYFNAPQGANVQLDNKAVVVAALPVKFNVPSTGLALNFEKTIIQEGEANSIELGYRKIIRLTAETKRNAYAGALLLLALLMLRWAIRRRRKRKAASGGASS